MVAMTTDAYDNDPDVAVLKRKSLTAQIPSAMYGKNPQLQPEVEYDYEKDPDVLALSTKKEKPQELEDSSWQKIKGSKLYKALYGAGEAATSAISGMIEPVVAGAIGVVKSIPEAIQTGQAPAPIAQRISEEFMRQHPGVSPQSELGKQYLQNISDTFESLHLPPVMPEALSLGEESKMAGAAGRSAKEQLNAQFANLKAPTIRIEPTGLQSAGAAAALPENILRGNIDAALTNASPETNNFVRTKNPREINLPALETKALEDKHGIDLTTGQRTGDTARYAQEWNKRAETPLLGGHFDRQPSQFSSAFENAKQRHAPDISSEADASELGQNEINALAAKDKIRTDAISKAYKALEEANGGQFPIDIGALESNIKNSLASKLKTSHLSSAIASDLQDFKANPTFEAYEALRTNLANEIRSSANGNARAAAYIVRDELEKLPIFGEESGNPRALELKGLADQARKLYKDRMDVINSNPAYKAAIKEFGSLEDASAQGESLNAANFHKKYVSSGTPESIRRLKNEVGADELANQSIQYGELERAKNALVNASNKNLTPEQFAKFIRDNKSKLRESLSPQAMQDVMELGALASKVGMPKSGVFNYSNTFSGMLGELAKQGLSSAAEAKLAAMTGGASLPATQLGKQYMQALNKQGFAKEAVNPFGGLSKEK